MTKTYTVNARWARELDRLSRRDDGRRELRQFHTAAGKTPARANRKARLSTASTAALAVGNGAVLGGLLGSLFGVTSGVVTGVLATVLGYVWIAGFERKKK